MSMYFIIMVFISLVSPSETIGLVMKHKGDVNYIPYDKNKGKRK